MFRKFMFALALFVSASVLAGALAAAPGSPQQEGAQANDRNATPDKDAPRSDLYTLDTCPISGQKLGSMGDPAGRSG